jgi:hypothetical protein
MSNTKLPFDITKSEAREYIQDIQDSLVYSEFLQYPSIGLTIFLVVPFNSANTVTFSVSQASPDEKKFHKLVGKYLAVEHFDNGNYITISKDTFEFMINQFD